MMWVVVALATAIATCASVLCFLVASRLLRTTDNALRLVSDVHVRDQVQLNTVLDRLMAVDFERFKSWQSTEGAEEGGFFTQEEQKEVSEGEVTVERRPRWGGLRTHEDVQDVLEDLEVPDDRLTPPR